PCIEAPAASGGRVPPPRRPRGGRWLLVGPLVPREALGRPRSAELAAGGHGDGELRRGLVSIGGQRPAGNSFAGGLPGEVCNVDSGEPPGRRTPEGASRGTSTSPYRVRMYLSRRRTGDTS